MLTLSLHTWVLKAYQATWDSTAAALLRNVGKKQGRSKEPRSTLLLSFPPHKLSATGEMETE